MDEKQKLATKQKLVAILDEATEIYKEMMQNGTDVDKREARAAVAGFKIKTELVEEQQKTVVEYVRKNGDKSKDTARNKELESLRHTRDGFNVALLDVVGKGENNRLVLQDCLYMVRAEAKLLTAIKDKANIDAIGANGSENTIRMNTDQTNDVNKTREALNAEFVRIMTNAINNGDYMSQSRVTGLIEFELKYLQDMEGRLTFAIRDLKDLTM